MSKIIVIAGDESHKVVKMIHDSSQTRSLCDWVDCAGVDCDDCAVDECYKEFDKQHPEGGTYDEAFEFLKSK